MIKKEMESHSVLIIGSTEGLEYARKLEHALSQQLYNRKINYRCTVWDNYNLWQNGKVTLESLVDLAQKMNSKSDVKGFVVAFFTPDDIIILREEAMFCSRDNVWLEYGLFAGILGSERVFAVCPQKINRPSAFLRRIDCISKDEKRNIVKWHKPTDFQQNEIPYEYSGIRTEKIELTIKEIANVIAQKIENKITDPKNSIETEKISELKPEFRPKN